jgi:hypothetical protein
MNRTLRSLALALSGIGLAAVAVFASGATPAHAASGCGSRGGPGYRLPSGRCASWADAGRSGYTPYVPPAPAAPAPVVVPAAPVARAAPAVTPAEAALWRELSTILATQQHNRERLGNMLVAYQAGRATGAGFVAEADYQLVHRQRTLEQATSLASRARAAGSPALATLADDLAAYLGASIQFVKDERALLTAGANPNHPGWTTLLALGEATGARFESIRARYEASRPP